MLAARLGETDVPLFSAKKDITFAPRSADRRIRRLAANGPYCSASLS
jgi:hypothetical protein